MRGQCLQSLPLNVRCAVLQQRVMMVKALLLPLFLLLTSLTGVCPRTPREICVNAGEMVALQCPPYRGYNHSDAKLIWSSNTTREMVLTNNMSSAEQFQMGVLLHGRSFVILIASVNHQGIYSCSPGNAQFRLTVNTTQTMKYEERNTYPAICYRQDSCTLNCPDVNVPAVNIPNMTSNPIIWHKDGESLPKTGYFPSVEETDQGFYTCTRSYLYHGQTYNMTFTVVLDVQQTKKTEKSAVIISPHMNDVFHVDLGSTVAIPCKAVLSSDFDEVFWLSGDSFVERNSSFPVFYNLTGGNDKEEGKMTASLFFKKVSEEDLSKKYTCKLDTDNEPSSSVTITLAQKPQRSYACLALGIVCVVAVMVLTVVIYVKFQINITLFLRDSLGCHCSSSDGKSYDAFLMCYKSDTDAGLNEDDRRWLKSILEETFGYSLCLYDRDVLPGKAVAEAVLDCVEQSRTVVLVPTSPDPDPGSGLLSAIHAALVERQTRLVFIKTETTEASRSGSLPEALQLLGEAGDCVTWKGVRSMPPSSSFWKQLRYHLPAPQRAPKMSLLPQTI
ncbi:interleukin-18 receptor 1-like [Chelmon rostratus]|uniref:interleukin-18 receptor 1-like n=1 Tax=Chelmon rostratus TaxID=109905 RepID=UPI001BE63E03|nr:interleukin-18 receptor 1-like [Chelmon rostratus]